jgi:hypothetical protein
LEKLKKKMSTTVAQIRLGYENTKVLGDLARKGRWFLARKRRK